MNSSVFILHLYLHDNHSSLTRTFEGRQRVVYIHLYATDKSAIELPKLTVLFVICMLECRKACTWAKFIISTLSSSHFTGLIPFFSQSISSIYSRTE